MNWRQRRARWQQGWLARRIPPARQITLQGRCLFILPTRLGLWYLLVMLAIERLGAAVAAQTGMLGPMATIALGAWLLITGRQPAWMERLGSAPAAWRLRLHQQCRWSIRQSGFRSGPHLRNPRLDPPPAVHAGMRWGNY